MKYLKFYKFFESLKDNYLTSIRNTNDSPLLIVTLYCL